MPGGEHVSELVSAFWRARSMSAAVELGIFDQLAHAPAHQSAADIATALHLDASRTRRLLRLLASEGLLHEGGGANWYTLSESGKLLCSEARSDGYTLRDAVRLELGPQCRTAWEHLESVMAGSASNGLELAYSCNFDQLLSHDQDFASRFNGAMSNMSIDHSHTIARTLQSAHIIHKHQQQTIVDIAGGHGTLLAKLLQTFPWASGIVFELPSVVQSAPEDVHERLRFQSGDMFSAVPSADAYCMKFILHDWDDHSCVTVLRAIKESAPATGCTLIICEVVMPDDANQVSRSFAYDMQMLMNTKGKERTEAEYKQLLHQGGFIFDGVLDTGRPMKIVLGRSSLRSSDSSMTSSH